MNNLIVKNLSDSGWFGEKFINGLSDTVSRMEKELERLCSSENRQLDTELKRIVSGGGKRLRPILALLGYKIGKNVEYPIIPAMCGIELVHTASLIHDDVVDKAGIRRGIPTINAECGDFFAVQAGDYLLAKSVPLLKFYEGLKFDDFFADTARGMCLAEFSQIDSLFKYNEDSLEKYFRQIKRKTAQLIASSVSVGAVIAKADESTVEALRTYGEKIGYAFQIKDDVLDYANNEEFGKKSGQDLKRGIFTLPLLYALRGTQAGRCSEPGLINRMRNIAASVNKTNEDIKELFDFVKDANAAEMAQEDVLRFSSEAKDAIADIEDSDAKLALEIIAESLAVRCI